MGLQRKRAQLLENVHREAYLKHIKSAWFLWKSVISSITNIMYMLTYIMYLLTAWVQNTFIFVAIFTSQSRWFLNIATRFKRSVRRAFFASLIMFIGSIIRRSGNLHIPYVMSV